MKPITPRGETVPRRLRAGGLARGSPQVRAIILRDQAVLVVRSPVPMLSVGGRPEPGETLEQALRREVAEEQSRPWG